VTREVLATPLVDFYSSQELGYMALQCPESEHYHVLSDSVVLEVVDEQGQPCPPGEPGRVLLTSLHNYATPLIRYDIDDRAVLGERCGCGRGLPVLKQVLGRSRNMISLPDGGSKWPNLGFRAMMDVADIQQFQVVQRRLERLELKLVLSEPLLADQERQLKEVLRRYLEFPFEVEITYHAHIPRAASGKYEDFLNLVEK
jgi:phenylacetate-CoA ligase